MEQLGGGCFTPLGIYCRAGHLIAEVLSLDGTRAERIETDVKTIEEAREQGRQLRARAQGLIDEAYKQLGITGDRHERESVSRGVRAGRNCIPDAAGPGGHRQGGRGALRPAAGRGDPCIAPGPGREDRLRQVRRETHARTGRDRGPDGGPGKEREDSLSGSRAATRSSSAGAARNWRPSGLRGFPVEMVPGISSALAVPASVGIPLTHRKYASQVTVLTGNEDPTKPGPALDWELLAKSRGTIVILMGVANLAKIVDALMKNGKAEGNTGRNHRTGPADRPPGDHRHACDHCRCGKNCGCETPRGHRHR